MSVSEACYLPAELTLIAAFHASATGSLATGLRLSGVHAGTADGGWSG